MEKVIFTRPSTASMGDWKQLFEAALVEKDPQLFPVRLQNATKAIMDEIEDSFGTASSADRLLLLAALNTVSGLFESTKGQRPRMSSSLAQSA